MNLYILYDKGVGNQLLHGSDMSCNEFEELVKALAREYGDDIYILKEVLVTQYGFKVAAIQCVHSVKK